MKVLKILFGLTLATGLFFASLPAEAQQEKDAGLIYKKTTTIIFDGPDIIEGDRNGPKGNIITSRTDVGHKNLIRLRDNFSDKILASALSL